MRYNPNNRFYKIIHGDIRLPANEIVHEDDAALAFVYDAPQAPVHVLVVPKGSYTSLADFTLEASPAEVLGFWKAVNEVTKKTGIAETGYRLITNDGRNGGQGMPHFHVHIVGGRPLGPLWPGKQKTRPSLGVENKAG